MLISKEEFERCRKEIQNFDERLAEEWERTRQEIDASLPVPDGRIREKPSGTFKDQDDVTYSALSSAADVSRETLKKFRDGNGRTFNTVMKIISVFESIRGNSAKDIWDRAFDTAYACHHQTIQDALHDPATEKMGAKYTEGVHRVQGAIVELRELGEILPQDYGTPVEHVTIYNYGLDFDGFDENLINKEVLSGLQAEEKNGREFNGKKYCLTAVGPEDISENGKWVEFTVKNTDFFKIKSCLSNIEGDEEERSDFRRLHGSPNPSQNLVPNAFCLHYLLRFGDGSFLAIHRHDGVAYEKRKVSVSGEEQLHTADFEKGPASVMDRWSKRAFLEEVVPLRNSENIIKPEATAYRDRMLASIAHVRCLTLIYEERYCNFALTCLIQLSTSREEYVRNYQKGLDLAGRPDFEGNRYWFDQSDLKEFFGSGKLRLRHISFDDADPIYAVPDLHANPDNKHFGLHSSSLHRLFLAGRICGLT